MGSLLVGAAGLMWGHVVVAGPSPGGGLGASRLLPGVTLGSCGSCGAVALAALGDFGVDWGCLHNSRYYVAEF